MMLGGGAPAVYPINQSLRFNSADAYTFRRTVGSDSTSQTKFTVSIWSKRGVINSGTTSSFGRQMIVYTGQSNGAGNLFGLEWREDEVACIFNGAGSIYPQTVAKFRDPSAWYHIVVAVDTDQTTAADRCKIYVNGVQQTLTGTLPGSGFAVTNGAGTVQTIGELGSLRSNQYLAEAYYINDQQLAPTDFAKTNDDGVWIPKAYEGTFTGTNSYYLKFDSAATNGIGHDDSGNSNTFTTTNFTTSGTGTDVMSDTPVTNYATFNPLNSTGGTLTNGNLDASGTSNFFQSTIMVNSGKYYFEFTKNANGDNQFGIAYGGDIASTDAFRRAWRDNNGTPQWLTDGVPAGSGTPESCAVGDVVGVALDMDNNAVYFSKNGTYMNSGDPTSGSSKTGAIWTDLAGQSWGPMASANANGLNCTLNCGQRAFSYTPPTGFNALNTSNLSAPTIKDGSDYFNAVLYDGDGGTSNTVTGLSFTPDVVWGKSRSNALPHNIFDVVRGFDKQLDVNDTVAEVDRAGDAVTPLSNGFTLDATYCNINNSSTTNVAWCWKAGGSSTQTLATGSQSATVSVNATAGISIATYTGTTSAYTVAHGLGVAPKMYINKGRDTATAWWVFHKDIGPTAGVRLDSTTAEVTATSLWNDTSPTSTVCHFGAGAASADPFLMYAFAEVENYSRFGKYTGNGNADGPFVYCGFRPAFVLMKRTNTTGAWKIFDNKRPNPHNVIDARIEADSSGAESTNSVYSIDLVSNGFKLRGTSGEQNGSGDTFVFAAFAENPFGGSGVSPVTAR